MRFLPKVACRSKSINLQIFPPRPFVAGLVQLPMMHAAEGYRELIADFETNRAWLGEAQMMWIGRLPPADETRLQGHKFQLRLIAQSFVFGNRELAFVNLGRDHGIGGNWQRLRHSLFLFCLITPKNCGHRVLVPPAIKV
jgi:hypothetical protein